MVNQKEEQTVSILGKYLVTVMEHTRKQDVHSKLRWWFRGQAHDWPLNPGVFRDNFTIVPGPEGVAS
jgi:hypothetical protein